MVHSLLPSGHRQQPFSQCHSQRTTTWPGQDGPKKDQKLALQVRSVYRTVVLDEKNLNDGFFEKNKQTSEIKLTADYNAYRLYGPQFCPRQIDQITNKT